MSGSRYSKNNAMAVEPSGRKEWHRSPLVWVLGSLVAVFATFLIVALTESGDDPSVGAVGAAKEAKQKPGKKPTPVQVQDVTPEVDVAKTNDVPAKHSVGEIWFADDGTKMTAVVKNGETIEVPVFAPRNRTRPKTSIFRHPSENQIANLLRLESGVGTFGNRDYKGFKDAFLKSCEEPISISPDDDEWTRQLKQDVIDAKKELKNCLDRGEDIEEIMRETRNEYKKLANIKRITISELGSALMEEGTTADDIDVLFEAANKILEENGIPPLKPNPFVMQRLIELKNGESNE